jgi:hypothetical protein
MADYKSLGLVPADDRTMEHDFAMLAKFQKFSAEPLWLAPIGFSAVAFATAMIFATASGPSAAVGH